MKNRKTLLNILILSLVASLFACGPMVYTSKSPNADLADYQSFAYLPNADSADYKYLDDMLVQQKTMDEIRDQMMMRGYAIDKKDPALLIKTHIMFETEDYTVTDPVYTSYDYYTPGFYAGYAYPYYYDAWTTVPRVVGYDVDEVVYTEGTIAVDVIDSETKEILWRGWADERIAPEVFEDDIKDYIQEIFDEYPVKKKEN